MKKGREKVVQILSKREIHRILKTTIGSKPKEPKKEGK